MFGITTHKFEACIMASALGRHRQGAARLCELQRLGEPSSAAAVSVMYVCVCMYIYIYIYTHACIIYIYI